MTVYFVIFCKGNGNDRKKPIIPNMYETAHCYIACKMQIHFQKVK